MTTPALAQKLYIDGIEIKIAPNWSINRKINNRGTMNCTIVDNPFSANLSLGNECYFYDKNDVLIFAGVLTSLEDYEDIQDILYYSAVIEDFSAIAKRPKAKIAYENKTIDYIVKDLIDKYLANTIDSDYDFEISEGNIEENLSELNIISFNYMSLEQCFEKLCGFGNYIWNIDDNKNLNFHTIGYIENSTIFNRSYTKFKDKSMKRNRNLNDYRNYQIVKGSKYIGDLRENEYVSPQPDGTIKTFLTKYPIAEKPRIWTINGGIITERTIGVLGYDNEENYEFYWSYDSNTISQNDNDTAIASGIEIRLNYKPLIPLLVIYKSTTEITNRGLYEHFAENQLLQNKQDALSYAKNLIDQYAQIADSISFTLYEQTYSPMEQMTIIDDLRSIDNETFLVESCSINPAINHDNIEYTYNVLDGARLGGWEEFFKNLFQPEKINVNENELIVVFKDDSETHSHDGEYNLTIYTDPLTPSATLTPTATLTPMNSSHSTDLVID